MNKKNEYGPNVFYGPISHYYDFIFSENKMKMDFVDRLTGPHSTNLSFLDIGCATGGFAILAANKHNVKAIDLDVSMIKIAREKAKGENPQFFSLDMLEISQNFSKPEFDIVTCFGNTLVHLQGPKVIMAFILQVYDVLKDHGTFIFQVLHYDRIFSNNIKELPVIENDIVKFNRYYEFLQDGFINFKTILSIKETKQTIENSQILYGIKKDEIIELLKNSGFADISLYGSYSYDTLNDDSKALIIICCK